ncbi:MAG: DNA-3-methyladenine glycosylase I [Chloroflexi bacterium]|nr:DNA-3-methyladenine glycosylase I [Chloroflexota bacterium]
MLDKERCGWPGNDSLMIEYHDAEWGVPLRDDRKLFEFLLLDGAQAGLSWQTVLRKREGYRRAFDNFDPQKIALYGDAEVERLMRDAEIIRNRQKIASAIGNARSYLQVVREEGSFADFIWSFVEGKPIVNQWNTHEGAPATSLQSESMSRELRRRGFRFVGPTICYAFMQAAGLVNDHVVTCFRYEEVNSGT